MRQSQLFTKTARLAPKDEISVNAQLLTRGGFVNKQMAGVYAYLPLGLLVLKKIENIIREEMNAIGGQELLMTTLQPKELWVESGRWDDKVIDNWFKSKLASGSDVGIANTHEEPITKLLTHYVSSHKDLPVYIYQFQNKFRNELRAKSGILRGREFMMKDMYSFSRNEDEFKKFYEQIALAYMKIFKRVGIGERTYRTVAAGGSFTTGLTDEFQTVCEAGEDTIYVDEKKKIAINEEVYNKANLAKIGLTERGLKKLTSIEIGNIFPLGRRYARAMGLTYKDDKGSSHTPVMGSYGIGLGRLMGAIVEVSHDERGIIWPESVAPFDVHLLNLAKEKDAKITDELYSSLQKQGLAVVYDDREISAGSKLADSDLIGIPVRIVVSDKTLAQNAVELKKRNESKLILVKIKQLENFFK